MKELGLRRCKRAIICLVVVLTLVLLFFRIQPEPQATSSSLPLPPKTSSINEGKLRQLFADQPLAFELNTGQADPRIRFLARGPRTQLLLGAGESTLLAAAAQFRLRFAGADRGAKITGEQQLSERRNYLLGNNCAQWQTDVPTFRRVTYENIYP